MGYGYGCCSVCFCSKVGIACIPSDFFDSHFPPTLAARAPLEDPLRGQLEPGRVVALVAGRLGGHGGDSNDNYTQSSINSWLLQRILYMLRETRSSLWLNLHAFVHYMS